MKSKEADVWKKEIKTKYDELIGNEISVPVHRLQNQNDRLVKHAFKHKKLICDNIKNCKARWVKREFEQCGTKDYFETYSSIINS